MEKDFDRWNDCKKVTHLHTPPLFSEGQVWWCRLGLNVGDEQDGKGHTFLRPVLVVRKFSRTVFIGVPLSTKLKENRFYGRVMFKGREQSVLLSQIRLLDARRLHEKMRELPVYEVQRIKAEIQRLIFA